MSREIGIRAAALYLPVLIAVTLALSSSRSRRKGAGILLGCLWNAFTLLLINMAAIHLGWWRFQASGALFLGMPVDLYLGWVVLWGAIPLLAFSALPVAMVILAMAGVDIVFMPQLVPVVKLGPYWLVGEAAAVLFCLLPSLLLARWTERDQNLPIRVFMQATIFAAIYIWIFSEIAQTSGAPGWGAALDRPIWLQSVAFQILAGPMLLGVASLQEFCMRGRGTPIPFDPPRRLVTSGPYAYVANPMQLATVTFLAFLGVWLLSWAMVGAAVISFIYSSGIARWDEINDMQKRFGQGWFRYRSQVWAWRLSWRPWHPSHNDSRQPKAGLYIAEFCGPCSEIRAWFEAHQPIGLMLLAAEDHPTRNLRRILYVSEDRLTEREGIAGVAAALQHIDLRWAVMGWIMNLPLLCQFLQVLVDATGISTPKEIQRRSQVQASHDSVPVQIQVRNWVVASYFHEARKSADLCVTSSCRTAV